MTKFFVDIGPPSPHHLHRTNTILIAADTTTLPGATGATGRPTIRA